MRVCNHRFATSRRQIFDEREAEGTTTILITLELVDSCLCGFHGVKSDDASALGATAWLILNLSLFDLADRGEELN
jgi:hypothetical protein